ncbi:MAG: DEAD/DEAH box helicase [Magnetococcales bacterium]|nr:DEAD/DEAH box helicase [Magnetococcales bacterium]NGZ27332.1 DEAD/DEAH box helicase [Magnetococcales bacterium]
MEFADLPIPPAIMAGIRDCGFSQCTPIQQLTLPISLAGKDVAGQAQTGTGKTAAYLIACMSRLVDSPPNPVGSDGTSYPRCLIIAPTRELVVQIVNDAHRLGAHCSLNIAAVYGGVDYDKQRTQLAQGQVDILIGTPGRLIDYFKQKAYHLSKVQALVIDEADRMFDMGFLPDLRYMLHRLPNYAKRLSLLFSATLSYRAQELSYEFMNNPELIVVNPDVRTSDQVVQQLYHVESNRKISLLVGLLRIDMVMDGGPHNTRVMIFTNTKRMGERLLDWLTANGFHAGYLSGDVPQTKRLKVLQRFQEGEIPILVATDVAGRGLHIDGITHVINYDMPENPEDYVHRIGRTARAGAKGDAISLVDEEGAYCLEAIEVYLGHKIPVSWAEDELFAKLDRPVRNRELEEERRREQPRRQTRTGSSPRQEHGSSSGGGERRRPPRARPVAPAPEAPAMASPPPAPAASGAPSPDDASAEARKRRRRRRRPAGGGEGENTTSTPAVAEHGPAADNES